MRALVLMELPAALELVILAVEAPRSITRRLHLDHLQGAASIVAPPFGLVDLPTISRNIVTGPLRPSTS
jgi:hypothetical protein